MVETTILVVAGKKLPMPRLFKRVLQVAIAVALTAGVFFVMIVGNGFLLGRGASFQAGLDPLKAGPRPQWTAPQRRTIHAE